MLMFVYVECPVYLWRKHLTHLLALNSLASIEIMSSILGLVQCKLVHQQRAKQACQQWYALYIATQESKTVICGLSMIDPHMKALAFRRLCASSAVQVQLMCPWQRAQHAPLPPPAPCICTHVHAPRTLSLGAVLPAHRLCF